jgi:putative membrane protein insertion efficiency factor
MTPSEENQRQDAAELSDTRGRLGRSMLLPYNVEPNGSSRSSVGVRTALFALRFYKSYLSLLFAGACRFEPTCSRYACEAIERFGLSRGSWLAVKRLARCQPLSGKFGFDPVPDSWNGAPAKDRRVGSDAGPVGVPEHAPPAVSHCAVSHHEVAS